VNRIAATSAIDPAASGFTLRERAAVPGSGVISKVWDSASGIGG
jgi:hypothetical protein